MTASETLARLKAWGAGQPSAASATLPWPRAADDDILVMAFVRMSGESSPWGVMVGRPHETPLCLTLPEPRNVDAQASFLRTFGPKVLAHLLHPATLSDAERAGYAAHPEALQKAISRRQIWLPGNSHVDMLHFLDFRFTLARTGDEAQLKELRAAGRACGWLFREAHRPGQIRVFEATSRLQQSYVFPAEPPRQAHLGYLLAWLNPEGDRDSRMAAAGLAETLSVGTTLDPDLERDRLEPLVTSWNSADRDLTAARAAPATDAECTKLAAKREALTTQIHEVLTPELKRRWDLTVQALRKLQHDERIDNPQLDLVLQLGVDEFQSQFWDDEARAYDASLPIESRRPFGSHPETDWEPSKAAFRYFMHLHAYELVNAELVHGDPALVERAIDSGSAFRATITRVEDEGTGRAMKAVWVMQSSSDDSLRLREESSVCIVGARKRKGKIRSIDADGGVRTVVVEIVDGKTGKSVPDGIAADDPSLVGREVVWIDAAGAGLSHQKTFKLKGSGPGAWLTHSTPAPVRAPEGAVRPDLLAYVRTLK